MGQERSEEITRLLHGWQAGDRKSLDVLLPDYLQGTPAPCPLSTASRTSRHDTLQSAALVNEAYLRLVGMSTPQWEGRTHFFNVAAQLMRQILVDHARRRRAVKRGAGADARSLDETQSCCRRVKTKALM